MVKIRTLNINSVSFITYLEKMVRYEQMKCKRFVLFFAGTLTRDTRC